MSDKSSNKLPQSTRIPEQKQITPEMEERLRQKAWAKEKSFRIRFFVRYVVIFLLVVVLPAAIVWYFYAVDNSMRDSVDNSSDGIQSTKQLDFLLDKGDASQLKEYSRQLDEEIATGQLPRQLAAFKDKLRIADELIRRDQDESSVRFAVLSKLSTLSALAAFDRKFGHREKLYDAELLAFCEQYTFDDDPMIRNSANVCEFSAHIQNYLQSPTDQEFAKLESKLDKFVSAITAEEYNVDLTPDFFVPLMSKSKNATHVNKFNARLAEGLQNSDEAVFRNAGDKIMDKIVIGTVNWDNMRVLIRIADQPTIAKLESLVTVIADNPKVSLSTFSSVLSCVEFLGPSDHKTLKRSLIDQLKASVANIANEDKREKVIDLIDRYGIRNSLVGKPFDLGGELAENPSLPDDVPSVVLFLSLATPEAIELVDVLKDLDQMDPLMNRYVIVCTDSNPTEDLRNQIKTYFPNGILIGPQKKAIYLEQCPISHVPYIIILDRKKRVAAMNVGIDQVRNHLSTMNNFDE